MTFWKTQSFKALQQSWYQRLEKAGFQDAEEMHADEMLLKHRTGYTLRDGDEIDDRPKMVATHRKRLRKVDQLVVDCNEAYYWLLRERVEHGEFTSVIDKIILTLFSEGHRIADICRHLNSIREGRDRETVRFTIRRYEMLWGMREYTKSQVGNGRCGSIPKRKWERRARNE